MERFESHNHIAIEQKEIDTANCAEMPIDLYETENHVVIAAGMPRCLPNKISLGLSGDALIITAEQHKGEAHLDEERTYHVRELPSGKIGRKITLPTCNHNRGLAHFNNGLLVVTFDK
jgi:HSP20 family molecular chaperone IbpA